MDRHFNLFLTLISLLLIFQTFSINSVIASDLDNLCSQIESTYTSKYQCHRLFNQDTRSTTANSNELAKIAIDILTSNITNLRCSVSASLKIKAYNPTEQQALETCSSLYSRGEFVLREAKYNSVAKDYKNAVNVMKSYFVNIIRPCQKEVNRSREKVHPLIAAGSETVVDIAYSVISTVQVVGDLMRTLIVANE